MSIRGFVKLFNVVAHQRFIQLSKSQKNGIIQIRNFSSDDNDKDKSESDGSKEKESSHDTAAVDPSNNLRKYSERSK